MVAVDAMGGDFAPEAIVVGSYNAAKRNTPVVLFGDEKKIIAILQKCDNLWQQLSIKIVHCDSVIKMDDIPTKEILKKKDSSLVRAVNSVVNGDCKAFVSAGNSGAILVAGTLISGRIKGVLRPAIGEFLPGRNGPVFFMDLGANVDCKPEHLEQFAAMGHAYVSLQKNIFRPKIALLSNGHEPCKGCVVVKQAHCLLKKSKLNFIGNIESRTALEKNCADVVVCDGFSGNVLLKSVQGVAKTLAHWLKQEHKSSFFSKIAYLFNASIYKRLMKRMDYSTKGGALLLGVNHPIIIAHGCSKDRAITNAILFAHDVVKQKIIEKFSKKVQEVL